MLEFSHNTSTQIHHQLQQLADSLHKQPVQYTLGASTTSAAQIEQQLQLIMQQIRHNIASMQLYNAQIHYRLTSIIE